MPETEAFDIKPQEIEKISVLISCIALTVLFMKFKESAKIDLFSR